MLKNYIKIAFRILIRNKVISLINIFGLSLGIAVCILILLYVQNEISYDDFHLKKDRIFRVVSEEKNINGEKQYLASQPLALGPALKGNFPEIEKIVRLYSTICYIRHSDDMIAERIMFADPSFFEIYSFPLIKGDAGTSLLNPNSVVLSESRSKAYFGNEDPIGKSISIKYSKYTEDFVVTGVMENIPTNSSINFDVLVPFAKESIYRRNGDSWSPIQYETFVLLNQNINIKSFQEKIWKYSSKINNLSDTIKSEMILSGWDENLIGLIIQPMKDIHLNDMIRGLVCKSKSPLYAYIFSGIALLILIIACINSMILNISRSGSRIREIGIRKISGGTRLLVFNQLIIESLLLNLVSLMIGVIFVEILLPLFNSLINENLEINILRNIDTILGIICIFIMTSVLSSLYPCFILTKYNPINLFKDKIIFGGKNIFSRTLIVLQYCISVFFVTAMLVILNQIIFMNNYDLGFNKENILRFGLGGNPNIYDNMEKEISQIPEVIGVARSNNPMSTGYINTILNIQNIKLEAAYFSITQSFIPTMGIQMKEGRNYSKDIISDEKYSIIVNEAFVKQLGWAYPVSGRIIEMPGRNPEGYCTIIGVAKNFNFVSLENAIKPMIIELNPRSCGTAMIKVQSGAALNVVSRVKEIWRKIIPDVPFKFNFLDESIDDQYKNYVQWKRIAIYSAIISIILSGLGLFGLSSLTIAKRKKEIGIRKVLGITNFQAIRLISFEFINLVFLGSLLSWPIAYYFMNKWLQTFAYRIELNIWYFLISALLVFLIALSTVGFRVLKAASANPVEALKYE